MTRDEAVAEIDRRQREDTPPQPGCVPVLLSSTTEPGGYTVEWRGTGVVLDDPIHGPAPVCPDCSQVIGETEPTVRRVRPWGIAHDVCPPVMHCVHWMYGGTCCRCGRFDEDPTGECDDIGAEPYAACPDEARR